MPLPLLLIALLAQVVTRAPGQPTPEVPEPSPDSGWVDLEPDVATRGTTATIVVIGARIQTAKTLQVSPPDGITIDSVRVLLPRNGKPAAEVKLTVAPDAEPGDRALLLTVTPEINMSLGARPGDDKLAAQLDAFKQSIQQRETKPTELGTLHINSHAIAVTDVQVIARGRTQQLRIAVNDPQGDIEDTSPAAGFTVSGGDSGITAFTPTVEVEAVCQGELVDLVLDSPTIQNRQSASPVILASVVDDPLPSQPGCELRVRIHDRDGNVSPWFGRSLK